MATVQIRNLDDDAYAVLKKRAADSGRSLQEHLRLLLEREAEREERRDYWKRYRADMGWAVIHEGADQISAEEIIDLVRTGHEARDARIATLLEEGRE